MELRHGMGMQAQEKRSKLGQRLGQLLQANGRMRVERLARILIIESDRVVRTMLELAFSYSGSSYEVYTAPSGTSALLQFGVVRPDVILLQIGMQNGDAWETLGRIRELSPVPVIAISDLDGAETRIQCLEAGADCCLTKPFGLRELHARVRVLLRREQIKSGITGSAWSVPSRV